MINNYVKSAIFSKRCPMLASKKICYLLLIASMVCSTSKSNDLEDLGFEIFINDPAADAKKEKEKLHEEVSKLPDFIDPETWKEDLELDAPEVQPPKEPSWEAIYKSVKLNGIGAEECCLRASRASRYAAEEACLSRGDKVWMLLSIKPDKEQESPDAMLGKCMVFDQNTLEGQQKLISNMPKREQNIETGLSTTQPYHCTAKAVARCYTPDETQ